MALDCICLYIYIYPLVILSVILPGVLMHHSEVVPDTKGSTFSCHSMLSSLHFHDDVIKRKHFLCYWPFVREFTGHWWIHHTKASDAELWYFHDLCPNKQLSKQSWGWWFEIPPCSLWHHCNVIGVGNLVFVNIVMTDSLICVSFFKFYCLWLTLWLTSLGPISVNIWYSQYKLSGYILCPNTNFNKWSLQNIPCGIMFVLSSQLSYCSLALSCQFVVLSLSGIKSSFNISFEFERKHICKIGLNFGW